MDVTPARHEAVVEKLAGWHEVVYLSTLFGEHSLQLQLSGETEQHMWQLIQDLHGIDGVTGVRAQMEVKVHKIRYIPHTVTRGRP